MTVVQPSVKLPGPDDVTRTTLPNGMTLLVRENWANPSVVVNGVLRGGSANETREQAGLAQFTAALLTRGTTSRSFEDIAETVESVGASIGVGSGVYLSTFGGKCLHEDLPTLLTLLGEVLQSPSFPSEQVERVRGQILNGIRQRETSTSAVARLAFWSTLYPPHHPFAWPLSGTHETIAALTRDDIARFYADYYTPQGSLLIVVGAVHTPDLVRLAESTLGAWQASPRFPPPPAPWEATDNLVTLGEVRRETRSLPGKTQSDLVLGLPGLSRRHPDYLALAMMNSVLGELGPGGRLGTRIRENEGLAYYARSSLDAGLSAGPWYAYAGVNPRHVERAVDLIVEEMRRVRETLIDERELADVKAYWVGSLPLDVETNEGVASELRNMELYNLGLDYLYRYPGLVNAISVENVQAVAQRWLTPDAYVLTVAGPES